MCVGEIASSLWMDWHKIWNSSWQIVAILAVPSDTLLKFDLSTEIHLNRPLPRSSTLRVILVSRFS